MGSFLCISMMYIWIWVAQMVVSLCIFIVVRGCCFGILLTRGENLVSGCTCGCGGGDVRACNVLL